MNPDDYLFYSSTGCNFSLIPPKPKIPVLTVRKEMYPFRFNDNSSRNHGNMPSGLKQSKIVIFNILKLQILLTDEKFSLEVEIQFVRESDKSTINTIRRRAVVDHRLTLADLPAQLLTELGCIIDPSVGQVEVCKLQSYYQKKIMSICICIVGLRLLDWSCLIPLDVVSEDLSSSTVGDKLSVLLNYLLFFYRVSM